MEALLVLLLIALLFLVVSGNSRSRSQAAYLEQRLDALSEQLRVLLRQAEGNTAGPVPPREVQAPPPEAVRQWAQRPTPFPRPAPEPDSEEAPAPRPVPPVPPPVSTPAATPEPPVVAPRPLPVPEAELPEPRPGFFERHPDLEKFIGENLISKIGIAILVIGIGFFVKFSIDQGWIGAYGRVAIGVLCGGILVGLAHRLHRRYAAFSSVLVGGGLAVLYFSMALAYQDYHLFPQAIAFLLVTVVTAFAIALSLLYDRQEVAIIALAGGFAAPFLVSNGSGNYAALFGYLLVLNGALLLIAYRKAWRLLNGIAFGLTALLFWAWMATLKPGTPPGTYRGGFAFATAFYLLFLAINLAHNIRERKRFLASDFGILLAVNALYFSAGLYLLVQGGGGAFKGLFSAGLGVFNFALAATLIRRQHVDKMVLYLLVGVTMTFVSLTAPLQLRGHSITLFWGAETVVLLWLFQQSRIRVLQWGLVAVWACCLFSLLMDWTAAYALPQQLPVLANRGFLTTAFVAACHAALWRLLRRPGAAMPFGFPETGLPARVAGTIALCLVYLGGVQEISHQFRTRLPEAGLGGMYLALYTAAFSAALYGLRRPGALRLSPVWALAVLGAGLLAGWLASVQAFSVQTHLLLAGRLRGHFAAHWLTAAITVLLFLSAVRLVRARMPEATRWPPATWGAALFAVSFISIELALLTRALAFRDGGSLGWIGDRYVRVGLPIVWGLCSFGLMWLGMRWKYRPLRIISLTLFCITLLKLFLFDIRTLGAGGKIAAFCSLGVLLLVVSFMYQRLKGLLTDDERHPDAD